MERVLEGKVAVVIGAGQTPGETVGNGRAASMTYARAGARIVAVDLDEESVNETADLIRAEGGEVVSVRADATDETAIAEALQDTVDRWGRLDVLHNNVGISIAGGDAPLDQIDMESFDRVTRVNLYSMVISCKYAIHHMRRQQSGAIINIASCAVFSSYPLVAYKTSKAAVVSLTENIAYANAPHGIRANAVLPGLMDTPMGIEERVKKLGISREEVREMRSKDVPLRGRMGTAWDVANASLFLVSDAAEFITGVALRVDGGRSLKVG
jgi:NAD(P)-dependent dehydrogenase (short-subunit alcohol dehydrogenase family)